MIFIPSLIFLPILGCDIHQFEEPQVVRYEIGQQFSWHYDAIPKVTHTINTYTNINPLLTLPYHPSAS